jgi:arylsulfatase A-like enzyme
MKRQVTRREFLERLGACAAGGAALSQVLNRGAAAQNNAFVTSPDTVPWTPPPTLTNPPNILLILVDQMRWPQWLNSAQTQTLELILPNILGKLRNRSYIFPQYYTASIACTPARGTLLTGLYAPQTAIYATDATPVILNPAFPTWGKAVQTLNAAYGNNLWWFGKWHLSLCDNPTPLQPYGFNTRTYPGGAAGNPSPNGYANEGVNGGPYQGNVFASDAEIAGDFIGWLQGQAPTPSKPASPWCATVSLINPHDIASAPLFSPTYFPQDQFPPPSGAPAIYSAVPSPWNYEDLTQVTNKPPLQYAFLNSLNARLGPVAYPDGGVTLLNQYYWLQNYVDQQVGRILNALENSSYAGNTVIVFAADHGEYGGSHGLHDKAGAVYDECIRVPLYVKYPGTTNAIAMNQMCSSVDIFGLMCDFATGGGGQWQTTYPDLAQRQSIWDFLYHNAGETRVVESGPLAGMPYIFHTTDETTISPANGPNQHIVGLRTKSGATPGGKLAVYSHWASCTTIPDGTPQDFEFYDYSHNPSEMGNDYSVGNPTVQNYLSALGSWGPPATGLIATELDKPLTGTGTDGNPLSQAQAAAQQAYFTFLGQTCS